MRSATPHLPRTVLLAGATGLVGRALLARLLDSERYLQVHTLLRRVPPGWVESPKLRLHTVDFDALPTPLPAVDDVYIALGTTIRAAGSPQAFRRVDFDAVLAVAKAAHAAGARHLGVVSALGADAGSRVFYNRVKGEAEAALEQLGYASLNLAQPSLLVGDRAALGQPARPGEAWATRLLLPLRRWLPARVRPIDADMVAAALVRATLAARPGVHRLSSAAMQAGAGSP